jgi:hypothetical protein
MARHTVVALVLAAAVLLPASAQAQLRLKAPRERAAGIALPVTVTGAAPGQPIAIERRTSKGTWFGIKAVEADGEGAATTRLPTPAKTRRWRLRARAGESISRVARVSMRPITLISVGDINLGDGPGAVMAARGARWPWTDVAPLLRKADIAFGNLECSVSNRGAPVPKQFNFRGPPSYLPTLRRYAGLDIVNLANNHTGDYGVAAMGDTVKHVRDAGLLGVGAGFDLNGARKPRVVTRLGMKVAFVGFSDIGPYDFAAGPGKPGTRLASLENIRADIGAARKVGDVVVATFHWGIERDTRPSARQVQFGRAALAAGATAVIGAHPHVLQPVVRPSPRRVVAYSLGNFVWSASSAASSRTGLLTVSLSARGVEAVSLRHATIVGTRPRPH